MNRRKFLSHSCTACLSMTVMPALLTSCNTTRYITGSIEKDGLIVSKDEFKIREKGSEAYRSFIIIRNDAFLYPICVYRFSEQEYTAIWMKCAHQGAELQASGDFLQCPAHGSEYNNKGEVTNGPADRDLRTFPVRVSDKDLFIDMRKNS